MIAALVTAVVSKTVIAADLVTAVVNKTVIAVLVTAVAVAAVVSVVTVETAEESRLYNLAIISRWILWASIVTFNIVTLVTFLYVPRGLVREMLKQVYLSH